MSTITDLADAVVSRINSGRYSQDVTAQRLYQPVLELPDAETLQVSVVPKAQRVTVLSRTENAFQIDIDVAVQKKVGKIDDDQTELDALMALVQEIIDRLRFEHLVIGAPTPKRALFQSLTHEPIYAREHLDQLRQFTSVVTVTYQVGR